MSAGLHHAGHDKPIDAERSRELETLLANPQFAAAVAAYRTEDDAHDIPYLGGSDTAGTTVFFDRQFVAAIKAGKVKIAGKPIDPRPTLKIHEAVEGAEIRLLKFDYTKAHDIATIAERHAVEHLGWNWAAYGAALKPFIRIDERETISNPPRNLLLDAYRGTPLYAKLAAAAHGPQQPSAKMTHAQAGYHAGPGSTGSHCAICQHFILAAPPDCEIVQPPIRPNDGCDHFQPRAGKMQVRLPPASPQR